MRLRPIDLLMGITVALVWGMGVVFAKAAINHFPVETITGSSLRDTAYTEIN